MSQLGEMPNDEFDAFFVVDTDSCIESFAGGIEDRKSTRLNSSHTALSRMPSSA